MKCCRTVLLVLVSLPAVLSAADTEWVTIFSEDFNGSALDTDKWSKIEYVNWTSNNWRQYMSQDDSLYVYTQATEDTPGTLKLLAGYGDYITQSNQQEEKETYACGGIYSMGKFSFQYGRVEVTAKFNSVMGCWPAIWLLPNDGTQWPKNGEIDIMEHIKWEGSVFQTLHYNNTAGTHTSQSVHPELAKYEGNKDGWNTYAVEWSPDSIKFFVNGGLTGTLTSDSDNWPFTQGGNEFYLILDQQVSTNPEAWSGGATNPALYKDPETTGYIEFDSVRVYSTAAMQSGSSFTHNGVTVSAADKTTLSGTAGAADFAATNADIAVAADAKGNVSIKGSFNNCRVVNANGKAKLTVDACASSARNKVEATGGDITFINAGDSMMVSGLTIGEDRTVAAYKAIDELEAYETTIILAANTGASFAEGSTLLANLTVYNGNTLTFDGALTLGSSLTLWGGQKLAITAAGAAPDSAAFLLFDSVESLTLKGIGDTALADGRYDATSVFSTIAVGGQELTVTKYDLMYRNGQVSLLSKNLIPEPATATLSLLALAGLLTRRRRG